MTVKQAVKIQFSLVDSFGSGYARKLQSTVCLQSEVMAQVEAMHIYGTIQY